MGEHIRFETIHIHSKLVACAHSCKYCSMGKKKIARIQPGRIHALLERFLEWETSHGMGVSYIVNYSADYDRATLGYLRDLRDRFPRDYEPLRRLSLGGLRKRTDEELRLWLRERQQFGCISAHGSFAGYGDVHDSWNGQRGNYDLIVRTLRIAGEIGMAVLARLFVVKSTLSTLQALNDTLDTLPEHENNWRYAVPYFYAGWGSRLEDERIDEKTRDRLPPWLSALLCKARSAEGECRSEREWIEVIRHNSTQRRDSLILNVTEDNIERLEQQTCDEIIKDLERRTLRAYAAIPDLPELCERYGDRNGTKIYGLERCLEMKWLDHHLQEHPAKFERQLTHLQLGN
jgi:hypothetical protein